MGLLGGIAVKTTWKGIIGRFRGTRQWGEKQLALLLPKHHTTYERTGRGRLPALFVATTPALDPAPRAASVPEATRLALSFVGTLAPASIVNNIAESSFT